MRLRDESRDVRREDGATARRPLWDTGWGPERAAAYSARRARYVTVDRLQLRTGGRAAVPLDFPYGAGRGPQRAEAAAAIAGRFGVSARRLDQGGRALQVSGPAEDVARFAAALPRVLDHVEQLGSWAARMYGACARKAQHAAHVEALGSTGRRQAAAYFRALAFRRVVEILTGPQDVTVPEVDPALPLWEQAATVGGVLGQYGWVEVRDAYDPADALKLLDDAEPVSAPAPSRPATTVHGEQLILFDPTHSPAPQSAPGPVVVIPCSGAKADRPAEAGHLYTGSLHTHARRTADALTAAGGTVLILSSRYGLLPLHQVIAPYDMRMGDEGSVTAAQLRDQAAELDVADAQEVILLTPAAYTQRAAAVWPHAQTPLAHLGIGRQRGRLTALRTSAAETFTTAA
ncbi:DUF6884 domain-containing protein [Streptomyces sp. NBUL23]|uniref:DUF6884 domain-containing protein n=1 Tax=Streptomyces sp. NBUL23 TaxID=3381354 RepID=UPI003871831D